MKGNGGLLTFGIFVTLLVIAGFFFIISKSYKETNLVKETIGEPLSFDEKVLTYTDKEGKDHAVIFIEDKAYELEIREME